MGGRGGILGMLVSRLDRHEGSRGFWEGFLKIRGRFLEASEKVLGRFVEGSWKVFGRFLEGSGEEVFGKVLGSLL